MELKLLLLSLLLFFIISINSSTASTTLLQPADSCGIYCSKPMHPHPLVKPPVTVPPPPGGPTCPIDTLKQLGACVHDLVGGLGANNNKCCPIIAGLVQVEAAACLCATLKIKALNLKIYVPIALQLLLTCGKTPPPGYTCSL
ncbi:hypothetical protein ACJIZ3_025344 [Penstemon smallii]|uniref:Bifunctional inhibitor/plant lipid transfer protein/seed storage helical domain-containing protein n=1 Tax=Penstemon smallii TaxID=265156 RepID=A0ABD3TXP5_9LAMI